MKRKQEILWASALKGWESPLAQRGLPCHTPGTYAFSLRIQHPTPRPPGPLSSEDGGLRRTGRWTSCSARSLKPRISPTGPSHPPAPEFQKGERAAGRGLGSGARVSFAKPTKDGRNHSPSLDGGWGVRPTEEEPGSARPQQGTAPTFEVKGTGRARKAPAPFPASAWPKGFPAPSFVPHSLRECLKVGAAPTHKPPSAACIKDGAASL